jgi:hypothetical protein
MSLFLMFLSLLFKAVTAFFLALANFFSVLVGLFMSMANEIFSLEVMWIFLQALFILSWSASPLRQISLDLLILFMTSWH